jgi:DNA-binding MarR family transcriptional regulator
LGVKGVQVVQPRRPAAETNDDTTVILGILESVGRNGNVSQRTLAAELGIALGLMNAYVKRCVKKGLIKVQQVPKRRFAYYLTPQGFAEKSRLTAGYLSSSFDFFRRTRQDCEQTLRLAAERGLTRIALLGASDLAEITVICAVESNVSIVAVVAPELTRKTFVGVPVMQDIASAHGQIDGAIVTETRAPAEIYAAAVRQLGHERVLFPNVLRSAIGPTASEQQAVAS